MILSEYKDMNTYEVIHKVIKEYIETSGIGPLLTYDIIAAIWKFYELKFDKIPIIKKKNNDEGYGPYQAIVFLCLKDKLVFAANLGKKYELLTLEFDVMLDAIKNNEDLTLKKMIRFIDERDGDSCETFLCQWNKLNNK